MAGTSTLRLNQHTVLFTGFITLVPGLPIQAQSPVPVERLQRPTASFSSPFSHLSGLRELSDGRLVVVDRIEAEVGLIDLRAGTARQVGRPGSGPGEYTRPFTIYAAPNDSTRVLDLGGRRLLTLDGSGRFHDAILRLPTVRGGFKPPLGIDSQGRVYLDLEGILVTATQAAAERGAAPVYRWSPGGQIDSLTEIRFPPVRAGPGGDYSGPVPPYQPRDAWAVDASGRVAVVRQTPYRVEWIIPGRTGPLMGPVVSAPHIRIGRAEREAYIDQLMQEGGFTVLRDGQGGVVRPPRPNPGDLQWPETLPIFEGPAWISPSGEVWVRRHRAATTRSPLFDLFDGAGRLVRQVELPADRRLVGLGNGTVYAVRVDDDGLQWLERYALAAPRE
jgi:hypothetical protein